MGACMCEGGGEKESKVRDEESWNKSIRYSECIESEL